MERSRVGIVIPALNESKTIADVVKAVRVYGIPIVVDDGSTDNTAKLSLYEGAEVVYHEKNLGYDSALNSGFKKAIELSCESIITLDADGQHSPELIPKFVDALETGADLVIGIRSQKQRFAEHIFAWYTSRFYGIKDPLCGMKAYRSSVYQDQGYFDSYGSIGTELMIFVAKKGYNFVQEPFEVRERKGSSRFGQVIKGNLRILRAMFISILKL